MNPVFMSNQTKVNFIPPEEELLIEADIHHLQLMLFNIWENAIKHNETPIQLLIRCESNQESSSIITVDNGKGMQSKKNAENWKGLGLAYVKKLMNEHKGDMELRESPGAGLTVLLNFPRYG